VIEKYCINLMLKHI